MGVNLLNLRDKYTNLIELAKTKNVDNLKDYLNLDEFFLQAERRAHAEEGSLALQRVDEKTYQDALAYVEKLLQETDDVIEYDFVDEADSALTDESKAEINKIHLKGFFSNKARIEEGAKHVAALDKNRPMTKRYKKYFGLGLALTILAGLLIASAAVAIGIALGPALPALAAAIGVIKLIGSIVCAYSLTIVVISFIVQAPEGLLFLALPLAPILAPLIGGIRLLNKAHRVSQNKKR